MLVDNLKVKIVDITLFLIVIVIGILLIRSILKEVHTRERIEALATELAGANDRLRVLDQQKSEFLSIASHQLRSPLTAIKGYSSMLLEGSFGKFPEKAREAVDRILQSSDRLVVVINDFLNISRIEQGRMKYEWGSVDLQELISTTVEELKPTIESTGLKVTFHPDKEHKFIITADYGKIKQVISNLIDNSIKYTPKGKIDIHINRNKDIKKIYIDITDTGIGIPKDVLPSLFNKFTRAKGGMKVNIQGTGLGLYVVKQLMKAHGGDVWAESAGEGKGSQFYVQLSKH